MDGCVPLREVMTGRSIVFPVLADPTHLHGHLRAQALAATRYAHQLDLESVVGVACVTVEKLRTLHIVSVILAVGHEEIEKAVLVVVCPGGSTASTEDE